MPKWSGKTPTRIHELELNTCNLCTANCIFCSRSHGVGSVPMMAPETFAVLVEQLADIDVSMIQTSGNGDVWLNPHYLDWVWALRSAKPGAGLWTYTNFALFDEARQEAVLADGLFDRVHVTVDSLVPWIYERSKNLNYGQVFANLEHWLSVNETVKTTVLYNHVPTYYARCLEVTGHRPARDYFTDEELALVVDEEEAIRRYFGRPRCDFSVSRINPCLWGERHHAPADPSAGCPKINVIEQVAWVVPNGDVLACCYCDRQDEMVCGNIHDEHLLDIFYGERRAEWVRKIKAREITDMPCRNPRCCSFGDGIEAK